MAGLTFDSPIKELTVTAKKHEPFDAYVCLHGKGGARFTLVLSPGQAQSLAADLHKTALAAIRLDAVSA